jgi:hypothetical protein
MKKILLFLCILINVHVFAIDTSRIARQDLFHKLHRFQNKQIVLSDSLRGQWNSYFTQFQDFKFEQSLVVGQSVVFSENGTGRLIQLDASGNLERIDRTQYGGDRFGAYVFVHKDTIYSIGGYGFWRTNGAIRIFNSITKEWNVLKVTEDVPVAQGINAIFHFSAKDEKLYVLYVPVIDEYVKGKITNDHVYVKYFDLRKKDWNNERYILNSKIGKSLSDIRKELTNGPSLILKSSFYDNFLHINLDSNTFSFIDENIFAQAHQVAAQIPAYIISYNDSNYVALSPNGAELYQIKYNQLGFNKSNWFFKKVPFYDQLNIGLFLLIPILILIFIIVFFSYSLQRLKKKTSLEYSLSQPYSPKIYNNHFLGILDEFEKSIVAILVANFNVEKTTTVDEINVVLGITKKPYKIRNNMRATALKIINKKFFDYRGSTEELILRVKSDDDKRFFTYSINESFISMVDAESQAN